MDAKNPHVLLLFEDGVQSVLARTLAGTKRVKFTCFDVSKSFIILGANSGGLYVFKRDPCEFLYLVPSMEGVVSQVRISLSEKIFAFATRNGTIAIVTFDVANLTHNLEVYREHADAIITDMTWNGDTELFVGDNTGKISAVYLSDLLSRTMFQTPCFVLMRLDSPITQLCANSHLLLISTLTKCFICDTEREQYKQVGQRPRNGEFGACLINFNLEAESLNSSVETDKPKDNIKEIKTRRFSSFTSVNTPTTESPIKDSLLFKHLKIYAARPGARIWEALIDGDVIKTFQFKSDLSTPPCDVILYTEKTEDTSLNIIGGKIDSNNEVNQSFVRLFNLKNRFVLAANKSGFYIFDMNIASDAKILLWTNYVKDIVDVRVLGNFIYVSNKSMELYTFCFTEIDKFLLKCYLNKQYTLCGQICLRYLNTLCNLVPTSKRLYLLTGFLDKIVDDTLRDSIRPLMDEINAFSREKADKLREDSGIVTVQNDFQIMKELNKKSTSPDSDQSNEIVYTAKKIQKLKHKLPDIVPINIPQIHVTTNVEIQQNCFLLNEYFKLSKISKVYVNPVIDSIIITHANLLKFHEFLLVLESYLNENNNDTTANQWCYHLLFRFMELKTIDVDKKMGSKLIRYVSDAFVSLNFTPELTCCQCNFPLVKAKKHVVFYETIGQKLFEILTDEILVDVCTKVPYMWKYYVLKRMRDCDSSNLTDLIPVLIQYNDWKLLDSFMERLDLKQFHALLDCYVRLITRFSCLACGWPLDGRGMDKQNKKVEINIEEGENMDKIETCTNSGKIGHERMDEVENPQNSVQNTLPSKLQIVRREIQSIIDDNEIKDTSSNQIHVHRSTKTAETVPDEIENLHFLHEPDDQPIELSAPNLTDIFVDIPLGDPKLIDSSNLASETRLKTELNNCAVERVYLTDLVATEINNKNCSYLFLDSSVHPIHPIARALIDSNVLITYNTLALIALKCFEPADVIRCLMMFNGLIPDGHLTSTVYRFALLGMVLERREFLQRLAVVLNCGESFQMVNETSNVVSTLLMSTFTKPEKLPLLDQ